SARSPLSSALVVSGLIHLGLVVYLLVCSFAPKNDVTEISMIGNFVQAQTPFAQSHFLGPMRVSKNFVKPQADIKSKDVAPPAKEDVMDASQATLQSAGASEQAMAHESLDSSFSTGAQSQGRYDEYTRDVLRLIHQKKVYPRMAQKMGHTGKIRVRLRIGRDGSVLQSEVVEESRYSTLNEAAKKLLNELGQLKPFPAEVPEKFWVFHVPIEYKL
ncbi:MAG: TonB family protein, partial [Bdellovibrionales bacterium]|nr:TonB family protein [Bdellovibrionales bacterium]